MKSSATARQMLAAALQAEVTARQRKHGDRAKEQGELSHEPAG
jgi:hypothetical protein